MKGYYRQNYLKAGIKGKTAYATLSKGNEIHLLSKSPNM